MIYKDDGYGVTQTSLLFFRLHKDQIGQIVSVEMINYWTDEGGWVEHPLRITGEDGAIWLSGCNSGYGGEGPHGSVTVLKELGYSKPHCNWPLIKKNFVLGPPSDPDNHSL